MKKSILTLALLVAGFASAFAVVATSQATLTLGSSDVTLRVHNSWSDAFDNGYDAKQYNPNGFAVEVAGERWAQWASNNLKAVNFDFGFTAQPTAPVVLNVSNVIGDLYINGTKLADGGTVTFNVADFDANGALKAGYLVIRTEAPSDGICFNYNILEINGHAGETLAIINGELQIVSEAALPAVYALNLSAMPADTRLKVILNGTTYLIDVNPTVSNL